MSKRSQTDLKRVDAMSDGEALRHAREDSDAQPTDAAFWADAELAEPRARKVPVHIRLDPEVLAWFKDRGPGYQSRINQVLETYVAHQKKRTSRAARP